MMFRNSVACVLAILLSVFPVTAHASGPRWVTGQPYYPQEGIIVSWYTNTPRYFTDRGDLSPYVSHDAADSIVAAAAGVWNVPMASLTLAYGGTLDEDASSLNIYPTDTGILFPSDIQSSNYLNKQIAVLYDYDGSITDTMLGRGASSPSSCRQNAVIESVDSISTAGKIQHAILVLNGRCTGPAPEQQLQLQYQLMRAFGRILGLGWSQTNDNVFTGTPTPTIQQAMHWPIMHPIDIICGPYTYQCLPQPFTLRDDDIASLTLLYPVTPQAPVAGKTDSLARASRVQGNITFPNGQGMQGVNIVLRRLQALWSVPEGWETTSAVSGFRFRRRSSTPINTIASSSTANMGSANKTFQGYYDIFRTPIIGTDVWQNLILTTQPINPLYTGPYAVGPYDSNPVTPSGSTVQQTLYVIQAYSAPTLNFNIPDASSCLTTQSATESSPAAIPATGWWTGNLCTYGRTAWSSLSIRANRSFTFEVTALDEDSLPTTTKSIPVLGFWNATDAVNTLPTIASAPIAFNSFSMGTTSLSTQTSQDRQLRIAIMDQRGDGRPDYAYQARILYADSVTPATISAKGGSITITGMGFRAGNSVTINGAPAAVSNWTANTITAIAPSSRSSTAFTADIAVRDLASGAISTMTSALSYQAPQPELTLLSAPSGVVFATVPALAPFSVKALAADGITPLANIPVTVSATSGQVRFEACGQPTCTLSTNFQGIASTYVTPLIPGAVTLSAASSIGTVTSSFTALRRIQTITPLLPELYLASKAVLTWTPQVSLTDNAASPIGTPVQWTAASGPITFNPATSIADSQSVAQTAATVGPISPDTQASASACAWSSVCTTISINGVDDHDLQLQITSGDQQILDASTSFSPVVFLVTDPSGHPVAGASVAIHQTLHPWTPPCPDQGRCPIAPIYNSSKDTLISNLDGTITLSPSETTGNPEDTRIAAASGTQGFASLSLQKTPLTTEIESLNGLSASK